MIRSHKPVSDNRTDPLERLNARLTALLDAGTPTPCTGNDDHVSDAPEAWERAKVWCSYCPVLEECRQAAAAIRPSAGVWAGVALGTPSVENRRRQPVEVTCSHCGTVTLADPRRRYCTAACAAAAKNQRERDQRAAS